MNPKVPKTLFPVIMKYYKCVFLIHASEIEFLRLYFPDERLNGSVRRGGLQTPIFDRRSEWDREIKRTGASEWRVCSINEFYNISSRFGLLLFCKCNEREEKA